MLKRKVLQEELDQLFSEKTDFAKKKTNVAYLHDSKKTTRINTAQKETKRTLNQDEIFRHFSSDVKSKNNRLVQVPNSPTFTEPEKDYFQTSKNPEKIVFKEREESKNIKKLGKKLLGLDIGFNSIKLTMLEKNFRVSILDREEINNPLNDLDEEKTVEGITHLLAKNKIKTKNVVVCLSERYLFLKIIKIVKMNTKELKKAVEYEIRRQHIPYRSEDLSIKYSILREIDNGYESEYEILLAAVPKITLSKISSIVKAAGLRPVAIDIDSIALLRFIKSNYQLDPENTGVFIHMGQNKTLVFIIKGKEFLWTKDIAIGEKNFTDSIADYLSIDSSQAKSLKKETKKYKVFEAMKPVYDHFISEIKRSLEYCMSTNTNITIDQIILSGEASEIAGMNMILGQNLGVPVTTMKLSCNFDLINSQNDEHPLHRFAVSFGLNLWSKKENSINLLPEKTRKRIQVSLEWIKPGTMLKTVLSAAFFILLVFSMSVYFSKKRIILKNEIAEYVNTVSELHLIQKNIDKYAKLKRIIKQKKSMIKDIKEERLTLAFPLDELSKIIPRGISVLSINFYDKRFTIKGFALDNNTMENFFQNLNSSYHFNRIDNIIIRKRDNKANKKWSFEVSFDLIL